MSGAPKRFSRYLDGGGLSAPEGLAAVMRAASRRMTDGPFNVIRDEYRHPGLTKREALRVLRSILAQGGKGTEVRVQNARDKLVFHVKRVPLSVYDDPFRDAYYSSARIDAGVDFCGTGPVYAIGPGVIVNEGTPSHTSTFGYDIAVYRLTAGPAAGKYVFFAEHYDNMGRHNPGDRIDSNTVLYRMNGCIEIGWSDGPPRNGSEAWDSGTYSEGQRSALGDNFSLLLVALGGKPGLTLGRTTTGVLPPGYPKSWRGLV